MNLSCIWFWKHKGESALQLLKFHHELLELRIDACGKKESPLAAKNLALWTEILNLQKSVSNQKEAIAAAHRVLKKIVPKVNENVKNLESQIISPQLARVAALQRLMLSQLIHVLTEFVDLGITV